MATVPHLSGRLGAELGPLCTQLRCHPSCPAAQTALWAARLDVCCPLFMGWARPTQVASVLFRPAVLLLPSLLAAFSQTQGQAEDRGHPSLPAALSGSALRVSPGPRHVPPLSWPSSRRASGLVPVVPSLRAASCRVCAQGCSGPRCVFEVLQEAKLQARAGGLAGVAPLSGLHPLCWLVSTSLPVPGLCLSAPRDAVPWGSLPATPGVGSGFRAL